MMRSCSSLVLCVVLMAGLAVAQQQGRAQQRLSPQQQQLLIQQQQRQQQQQRPQQQQQRPRPPPGSLDLVSENQSLAGLNDGQLQRFLANADSVKILTDCFVEPRQCTSKSGINLIKQVRSLGIGGRCKTCTPAEQERLGEMIYDFIQGYQTRYPDQWRRVLPHLGTLITAVPNN